MKEPPDREHRDLARFRLGENVVVEAGAGTGKTTLLTDRILFLVLGWDKPAPVKIDRVVALTFTDKAAGEIKLRLSDRLVELAANQGGRLDRRSPARCPSWPGSHDTYRACAGLRRASRNLRGRARRDRLQRHLRSLGLRPFEPHRR